jgi:aminobenzoyl-glutamate utilization protein B
MAAAEAAALGTGTELEAEVIHGNHSLLPNEALAGALHRNLSRVGGVQYSAEEREFARRITETLGLKEDLTGQEAAIKPQEFYRGMGSTDVGDVSWQVPTAELRTATWVPGTAAHSWQAIAAGGTSIGYKGMMVAAKTLALTAADLYQQAQLLQTAQAEYRERIGPDFRYQALLGDRAPPLDYRSNTTTGR